MAEQAKLSESIEALEHALSFEKRALKDPFFAAGIAKSFESCFEYAWKTMKTVVTEHGLEAFSPRDAIKAAGRIGLIQDVEAWLGYLEDRNLSVHDYLGIGDAEYLVTIKRFLVSVKDLLKTRLR
jgi:nucleotidyltransferase substrate binding protein (TIGR01987 family)